MRIVVAAVLLCLALPGPAPAGILYPDAISFGPSYAIGPPAGFPWGNPPAQGSPIFIFGMVGGVGAPFSDLLPASPCEMTVVFQGGIAGGWGMWDDIPCSGGMYGSYYGGTMSIYLDMTPDADFSTPATFQDGELVLQAQVQAMDITDDDPFENCPMVDDRPDAHVYFAFSGGSWLYRVLSGGIGLSALGKGELPGRYPDLVPAPLRALNYVLRMDGTVDIFGPVAAQPTTWGRVKSLYR